MRPPLGPLAHGHFILAAALAILCVLVAAPLHRLVVAEERAPVLPPPAPTVIGINLFGLDTFNRQQVFANLVAQSVWFSSRDGGWTEMPASQLDRLGWVRHLELGQTAPRPLILPPAPFRPIEVRCEFRGTGELSAGGVARVRESSGQMLLLDVEPTGAEGEGAWIELLSTDAADPLREIDCRDSSLPRKERFHPEFLAFLDGFRVIRFLDWQRVNDNLPVSWEGRTLPASGSQAGRTGASIEDMVALANRIGSDPWFLMPYRADETYIRQFAELVHEQLDPRRTVYIEFGNEIWNDLFDAARQAKREGLSLGLGGGDPVRAQALRYAQQHVRVMRVWTEVFADRPRQLVRVAAAHNANPQIAELILNEGETARWTDALATAPYAWMDMEGYEREDVDAVFAAMPGAIADALAFAAQNRATAVRHGKRFIAYEGGQHLVPEDLELARAVQRDARMERVYAQYITAWQERMGDALVLYASTAPISQHGSWGLREYAGQPDAEAPKLRAVRMALKARR